MQAVNATSTPNASFAPASEPVFASGAGNESTPDFDFDTPCRHFKSAFARSLSLHNAIGLVGGGGGNLHSLQSSDIDVIQTNNTNNGAADTVDYQSRTQRANDNACNAQNVTALSLPPPMPARRLTLQATLTAASRTQASLVAASKSLIQRDGDANASDGNGAGSDSGQRKHQNQLQHLHPQQHCSNNNNLKLINNNFRRNIWPREDCQVARLRRDQNAKLEQAKSPSPTRTPSRLSPLPLASMPSQLPLPTPASTSTSASAPGTFKIVHEDRMNVEAVILQNQVDTLQWQLKQVETNCDMYRAVIEEVARFFDRYHSQKQQQQQQQLDQTRSNNGSTSTEHIARSKSLYHVYAVGHEMGTRGESQPAASYLRARSSTNLDEMNKAASVSNSSAVLSAGDIENCSYDTIAPCNTSYTAFKDFTWRRSPKKQNNSSRPNSSAALAAADCAEQKLSQEAFRLARTIHNLLNTSTQQPDLAHNRNSLASLGGYGRLCNVPPVANCSVASSTALHNSTMVSTIGVSTSSMDGTTTTISTNINAAPNMCDPATAPANAATSAAMSTATVAPPAIAANKSNSLGTEILFLRSSNMRDSRLSLRSSTDSSVHSTTSSAASSFSSSKTETDDEPLNFHPTLPLLGTKPPQPHGSTTEDESGFSSISSLQDIGVPLSSTLLSNIMSPAGVRCYTRCERRAEAAGGDMYGAAGPDNTPSSRNSTLKAAATETADEGTAAATVPDTAAETSHPNNVVGLPLQTTQEMPLRWNAPAKTYHNANKFQRFSTLSQEDSNTVLWV